MSVLISSHIFSRIKKDWKGNHFMVLFMFAACALQPVVASIRSFSFLAITRFRATFDATLWTRLCTVLWDDDRKLRLLGTLPNLYVHKLLA
jgi:hypothetical protein